MHFSFLRDTRIKRKIHKGVNFLMKRSFIFKVSPGRSRYLHFCGRYEFLKDRRHIYISQTLKD